MKLCTYLVRASIFFNQIATVPKMKLFSVYTLCYVSVAVFLCYAQNFGSDVHFMEPGDVIRNERHGLQIFCHNAKSKYLVHIWKSLVLHLRTVLDNYEIYDGKTPMEVREKHEDNQRSWKSMLFGTKKNKMFKMNPFEDSCIGIYTQRISQFEYEVALSMGVDYSKVGLLIVGVIIFLFGQHLSRNTLFYYICGILLGVTTSVLILIYFISKLFPRGKFMYLTAITGYTMSIYLVQMLWDNAQLIARQYKDWVMCYILATSLISFVICYRFGPVTNERTKKIIQWFLQILGLAAVYYSSYFVEASIGICVILILAYNFPSMLYNKGVCCWKRMFPERRKLLTDDQYREEGIRETNKALHELKEYCNSPECKPWKMVLTLKDPIRFAKFVEGNSHLVDDESRAHDAEITKLIEEEELTDEDFNC